MQFRRIALTVATTAAVTAGAVSVPTADAYTVDYDSKADKCTISYTEKDKTRINEAYKNLYFLLAKQLIEDLYNKEDDGGRYTKEQRQKDIETFRTWAEGEGVKDPSVPAPGSQLDKGSIASAQSRLFFNESETYGAYTGLLKASKGEKITNLKEEITPAEAEERAQMFGLDLKSLLPGLAWSGITGGFEGLGETAKKVVQNDALKVAAPVAAYSKSLKACTNGESESSSVPAGSSLSLKGLGISIGAGILGLFLLSGIIGFALRPVVDQYFAK